MTASRIPEAAPPAAAPADFLEALNGLREVLVRDELEFGVLPPPQRLAPWTHAISALVHAPGSDTEIGSGRLVLLHDPDGVASWNGTFRYVIFVTCEVEGEIARDPLLPDVAWSWLTDALEFSGADYTALGGTVTATSSVRFGDISGTSRSDDVEIRASWTALDTRSDQSFGAFAALLAVAAGLPPEGIAAIRSIRPPQDPG